MRQLFELCAEDRDIRFSPFVWMVRMALHHKDVAFEGVPVMFLEKEPFVASGSKTVPTFKDGDTWVSDSLQIALYLERTYPEKPLFGSDIAMAQAGMVQQMIVGTALGPLFPMVAADIWAILSPENQTYFRETRESRVGAASLEAAREGREDKRGAYQKSLGAFRGTLESAQYLCGETPAWTDYVLFGAFAWVRTVSPFDPLEGDDVMTAWRERMLDLFDGEARNAKRAHS